MGLLITGIVTCLCIMFEMSVFTVFAAFYTIGVMAMIINWIRK